MSTQDKIERILKRIHMVLSAGKVDSENPDKVIIDKKEMLSILEKLNIAIYEIMDQYEATAQAREMAERRSEKKSQEFLNRVSGQADDVYAASLMYTDDALSRVYKLMADAMASTRTIWDNFQQELEVQQEKVKEDKQELQSQLQEFKDSQKYLKIIESCNKEREKQAQEPKEEKKIQNQEKHYTMNVKPEIKVNTSYLQRKGITEEKTKVSPAGSLEEETKPFAKPEIKVDLDAEYFKWQEEEKAGENSDKVMEKRSASEKKDRKGLFGKK